MQRAAWRRLYRRRGNTGDGFSIAHGRRQVANDKDLGCRGWPGRAGPGRGRNGRAAPRLAPGRRGGPRLPTAPCAPGYAAHPPPRPPRQCGHHRWMASNAEGGGAARARLPTAGGYVARIRGPLPEDDPCLGRVDRAEVFASACRAISVKRRASSTPVGPPPMTTTREPGRAAAPRQVALGRS